MFNDITALEDFLKSRIKNVIGNPTPVDKFIKEALTSNKTQIPNSLSVGPPAPKPCNGSNMNYQATWNIKSYDASTNMNLQVNYTTNSNKQINSVNLNANPYGSTPDEFSISNTQKSTTGNNIHITFTTTQTNKVKVGPVSYNSTSVTNWTIDLNTCDGLATTSYTTNLP